MVSKIYLFLSRLRVGVTNKILNANFKTVLGNKTPFVDFFGYHCLKKTMQKTNANRHQLSLMNDIYTVAAFIAAVLCMFIWFYLFILDILNIY